MGEMVEFQRPDGGAAPGYYVRAGSGAAGVVLFEEWWGLTDHIKEIAQRLGDDGFSTLVPDLFRGRTAATSDEANHLMEGLDFAYAVTQDGPGAAGFLRDRGCKRVGVMGYCVGGALAMLAAMNDPDFDSAVIFYGYPPPEAGDPAAIRIPILGHWALSDGFFKIEGVDAIERKLQSRDVPYEFYRYDAKHAFSNPGGLGNYDRDHAETAWRRTIAFLRRTLAS
jgi:carboxymethylenebutenolidase